MKRGLIIAIIILLLVSISSALLWNDGTVKILGNLVLNAGFELPDNSMDDEMGDIADYLVQSNNAITLTPETLTINPGSSKNVIVKIKNIGTTKTKMQSELTNIGNSNVLPWFSFNEPLSQEILSNQFFTQVYNITVPSDALIGNYEVKIKTICTLDGCGNGGFKTLKLKVEKNLGSQFSFNTGQKEAAGTANQVGLDSNTFPTLQPSETSTPSGSLGELGQVQIDQYPVKQGSKITINDYVIEAQEVTATETKLRILKKNTIKNGGTLTLGNQIYQIEGNYLQKTAELTKIEGSVQTASVEGQEEGGFFFNFFGGLFS